MNVRDRFFNELYERIQGGTDAVVVSSDLGAPSLDELRRNYPQRFVNVGIAEQNSIAVAAGLCMAGKIAVTYGLNPFPVTRGLDHIRNLMASLQIPITVAALKAGTSAAEAGLSHMALENLSVLRTLRNIRLISPTDETIAKKTVDEIIACPAPRYVQFDPAISGTFYDEADIDFSLGFVRNGEDSDTVIVTGGIWACKLRNADLPVRVIDCFALPLDEKAFLEELKRYNRIITLEDGIICGGLGTMTLELLNDHQLSIPVKRMGLRFREGYPSVYTDRAHLFEAEGLTMEVLEKEIRG